MVRVAFVGCGAMMEEHCKHLSALPNIKFGGFCDTEIARAKTAADRFGGEPFNDFVQMYDKVKPRAVYVCVPPYAHGAIEEAAAERGIHLFIEKPVALERAAACRIGAAVAKAKIVACVGYCYRYHETVAMARRLLKGKAISLAAGYWNGGLPGAPWWRRVEQSGGQIIEQSTHVFDLLRHLCGEVAEVHAFASRGCMTKVENYSVDDSSVVSLRMKNGATASITSTCVLNHDGRMGLEIMTPEATLAFQGDSGTLKVIEKEKTTEYNSCTNMYQEENLAFIDAVRNDKRSRIKSSYTDALKTFMVTCAANESIQSGLPVKP